MKRRKLLFAPLAALLCLGTSAPTMLAQSSGGGGGGGTTSAPSTTSLAPGASAATIGGSLSGGAPSSATATISGASGGVVIAGNAGFSFPPGAFGSTGNVTVNITANPPSLSNINAGGPSQFSPNGTIFDLTITDPTGAKITAFPQAITVVAKPNAADLAMAIGNFNLLTLGYVIDSDSPAGENPNHYPINTVVIEPPSVVTVDPTNGVISATLNFLGSVLGVVTNPVGYVQTLKGSTQLFSSFDPAASTSFGAVPQFSYLQVVEPQVGTRLYVINPKTNNFAYVNVSDIGPSGPPPGAGAAKGLLGNA